MTLIMRLITDANIKKSLNLNVILDFCTEHYQAKITLQQDSSKIEPLLSTEDLPWHVCPSN